VTVPAVVADDDDAEHAAAEQRWSDPQMVNLADVAGVIPGLRAARVYPTPGLSIDKFANEATPAFACTVTVPDRDPEPGFDPMATVTAADEPVTR
jgi:hypothetical protein